MIRSILLLVLKEHLKNPRFLLLLSLLVITLLSCPALAVGDDPRDIPRPSPDPTP